MRICKWNNSGLRNGKTADLDPCEANNYSLQPLKKDATTSMGGPLSMCQPVRQLPVVKNRIGSWTPSNGTMALLNHFRILFTKLSGIEASNSLVAANATLNIFSPQFEKDC